MEEVSGWLSTLHCQAELSILLDGSWVSQGVYFHVDWVDH